MSAIGLGASYVPGKKPPDTFRFTITLTNGDPIAPHVHVIVGNYMEETDAGALAIKLKGTTVFYAPLSRVVSVVREEEEEDG